MSDFAPKELLQFTSHQEKKLHQVTASNATEAGHPVTASEVNPHDESPLHQIEEVFGEFAYHAGSYAEEALHGKNSETSIRVTEAKEPISIAAGRERLRGIKNKLLGRKAA